MYAHAQPYDSVIFKDDSVPGGKESGRGFVVYKRGRVAGTEYRGLLHDVDIEHASVTKALI